MLLAAAWAAVLLSARATPGAPGGARPGQAAAQPGGRAITGRVVSDSGQPLADAAVYLRRAGSNSPVLTATTDEDGRFRADNLQAGSYTVVASARGYVTPPQGPGPFKPNLYGPGDSVSITLARGGVITGKVLDARGEPVTGVGVRPVRVADAGGEPPRAPSAPPEAQTDDRGVYRLYGLEPGLYIVAAAGAARARPGGNPFEYDAPTYHPSATREGAAEVRVESGAEVGGVDIRYRGERGRAVGGTVEGLPAGPARATLMLNYAGSGVTLAAGAAGGPEGSFTFYGVPEGEYDLLALARDPADAGGAFALRRVAVKGADVTGLRVTLAPLGSIAGHVQFEPGGAAGPDCQSNKRSAPAAVQLIARPDAPGRGDAPADPALPDVGSGFTEEAGEFVLPHLAGGRYRVEARPTAESLYVKSVTLTPPARASAAPLDAAREGLSVAPGEQLKGVAVTLAEGAAALAGRVGAGGDLHAPVRLHLVPAERESADEVLRYAEAPVAADGSFSLKNLSPGLYRVVVRPSPGGADSSFVRPAAWDAAGRESLQREAEAADALLRLRPCQQMTDYAAPSAPPPKTSP